jgi:hypothetical protein
MSPDNTYVTSVTFQYSTSIMTDEKVRNAALKDTLDLYASLMS